MGAQTFIDIVQGKSAAKAFADAVHQAQWEHGHGGYTGTLAEKHDFIQIPFKPTTDNPKAEAIKLANSLLDAQDPRVDDKWGPAGCIAVGNEEYIFFGWASS